MRYFAYCKISTCRVKTHINFEEFAPINRDAIRIVYPNGFWLQCVEGHNEHYDASDVWAEPSPGVGIGGALLGSLGYMIGPISGTICVVGGGLLALGTQRNKINTFNRS